jgi:hypothetical protein
MHAVMIDARIVKNTYRRQAVIMMDISSSGKTSVIIITIITLNIKNKRMMYILYFSMEC